MNRSLDQYRSYLLRLWRPDGRTDWRIMVESVGSGERQSFPDLESLHEFLKTQIAGNGSLGPNYIFPTPQGLQQQNKMPNDNKGERSSTEALNSQIYERKEM